MVDEKQWRDLLRECPLPKKATLDGELGFFKKTSDLEELMARGNQALKQKHFNMAEAYFSKAISEGFCDSFALFLRAEAYEGLYIESKNPRELHNAFLDYKHLEEIEPNDPSVHLGLTRVETIIAALIELKKPLSCCQL